MSVGRRLRRAAQRDTGKAIDAKSPAERFAKEIAQALGAFGASGAQPEAAALELLRFAAQFAAFHEIEIGDFVEQARVEYQAALGALAEAAGETVDEPPEPAPSAPPVPLARQTPALQGLGGFSSLALEWAEQMDDTGEGGSD